MQCGEGGEDKWDYREDSSARLCLLGFVGEAGFPHLCRLMPETGGTGALERLGSSPRGEKGVQGVTHPSPGMVAGSCG